MNEKPKLHVVSFSGGKDSTAMLLRMIEENYPIDIILHCDTGIEFPEMDEHIRKVEKYIGRKITVIKSEKDYMYWGTQHVHESKSGEICTGYGYASVFNRSCTGVLKRDVIDKYFRELRKDYEIVEYVGIAYDEPGRKGDKVYPLIDWEMTEAHCLEYCYSRGFDWRGLYKYKKRVSCWCCPLQSLNDLRFLYYKRPELWFELMRMDVEFSKTARPMFKTNVSLTDIERRFEVEDEFIAQGKKLRTKEFFQALRDRGINY